MAYQTLKVEIKDKMAKVTLDMSWEASMNYTFAKENEMYNAQKGGWLDQGVGDFVAGKSKPGTSN